MRKFALLIGVSDYAWGLQPLPKAVLDVDKLEQVLKNPEIGGFEKVDVLRNPDRQLMEVKIEEFFADSQRDDLLLLYFSGHGVVDEAGNFYLSSRSTCLNQNRLRTATAVKAKDIHSWMSQCKSKRQAVILDCCNAGAFAKGLTAKDAGKIDIQAQLGGEGRAILTAATSTQYAFEQDGLNLSIYTHYLVEGLEKGSADLNNDGQISVEELHEYISKKVKEAAPAMTPEIYNLARDTEPILIARSPKDDPKLKYRKEVERLCGEGCFSIPAQRLLKRMRLDLKLAPEVAEAIEAEVLQPWKERERKLQEYRETIEVALAEAKLAGNPLNDRTLLDLQDYQNYLGLRDEDIQSIHTELLTPIVPSKPLSNRQTSPTDEFASEKGIDYTRLRDLLAAENWKESNQETYKVMIQAVGKKTGDWFTGDELLNFPCTDLKTIDSLWVKYSNGHFGFSVQKKIYVECGAALDGKDPGDEISEKFCDRVGWRAVRQWLNCNQLEPSFSSPQGRLPYIEVVLVEASRLLLPPMIPLSFLALFSRTETCRL
jgi:hypothetical protein